MKTILFATSNPHKVREGNKIAREFGIRFEQINVDYPEIRDENIRKIAAEGVKFVFERIKKPVIVEDTGLFIDALNGFPGPYSAYVYKKIGCEGILKLLQDSDNRDAEFITAIGFKDSSTLRIFEGRISGTISNEKRGTAGFGYDPIFIPKSLDKTFAEDPEMKDRISHRRNAFYKFCQWFSNHLR